MTRAELKDRAKAQLGRNIFGTSWMVALAVSLIASAICAAAGGIGLGIGAIVVVGPISFGTKYLYLKQSRDGNSMEISELFKGFTDCFGDSLLIGLMTAIFTFLWGLLFIIPGIVKAFAYSMSYYVKADHPEYNWKMCIDESQRIMRGHKFDLFVLYLSFIGWYIVGTLCFGIGTLWVVPYFEATIAQFYESIKS